MSRDWTPAEHYFVEQHHIKNGHGSLWDFLDNLKFVDANGTEEVVNPPEEMAIRRQFPMLGRLLMDEFIYFLNKLLTIDGGIEFLHKKDEELGKLIASVEAKSQDYDKESYLYKWFVGKLAERFYYGERNNYMFCEMMVCDAQSAVFFEDIKKQIENKESETSYGEPQAWIGLDNGRSIEVVLEQEGLSEEQYFYSVRLHCNEAEFDNNEYHGTYGVITQLNTASSDIDEIRKMLVEVLFVNSEEPVEPQYLPEETVDVCVYKDVLGCPGDDDNLTYITVPLVWLKGVLKDEGVSDYSAWSDEYTADYTENIARRALNEGVIKDCSDDVVKQHIEKNRPLDERIIAAGVVCNDVPDNEKGSVKRDCRNDR